MMPISALQTPLTANLQAVISQGVSQGAASAGKTVSAQDLKDLASAASATPASGLPSTMDVGATGQTGGGSFSNLLGQFVGEVNSKQTAANDAVTGLLSGGNVSLHQAMIAMEEANVSFQLMIEVRNKLLDSYQELMRMQV